MERDEQAETIAWPVGGGEMGARIRAHDWAATPLGPSDAWPERLRFVVETIVASPFPMAVVWGAGLTTFHNDAFLPILGDKPDALGRGFDTIWREAWPTIGPLVARTLGGDSVFIEDFPLVVERGHGLEEASFTFAYSPLRDEAGAVVGLLDTVVEMTGKRRVEAALRESEERLRLATEAANLYAWDYDMRAGTTTFSANTERIIGAPMPTSPEEITRYTHPDDRQRVAAIGRRSLDEGLDSFGYEFRSIAIPEEVRHFRVWCTNIREAAGTPIRRLGITQDVTAQRRTEERLRESEERQAFLLRLGDALGPLDDPIQVQSVACRTLGEYLAADRVNYAEVEGGEYAVATEYRAQGLTSMLGRYAIVSFRPTERAMFEVGRTVAIADIMAEPDLTAEAAAYGALGVRAFVSVPLVKQGRLVVVLSVIRSRPVAWRPDEVTIVEETAERTWAVVERARAEAALRESEARLQLALDATAMGTFVWHVQEDRGEPDARMLALFGQPPDGTLNLRLALEALLHPDDRDRYAAAVARAADPAGTGELREDIRVLPPGGAERWLAITAQVAFAGLPPRPTRMAGTALDITERKRVEAALRASEERYRAIVANLPGGAAFVVDRELRYRLVAGEALGDTGLTPEDLLGKTVAEALGVARAAQRGADYRRALAGESFAREHEERGRTFLTRGVPLRDAAGVVDGVLALSFDITERRAAEAALRETLETLEARVASRTAELRALSRQLLGVREEEQRHLARELHDQIGQLLTGLRLTLNGKSRDTATMLAEAAATVDELQARVRTLTFDLRPTALDDFGLRPALEELRRRYTAQTGVEVALRHSGLERRFPPAVETTAYRVVQEALTNVARHAGVATAIVQLVADDEWLIVQVRDTGQGFVPEEVGETRGSLGLAGMRERIVALDGILSIESAPQAGTVVIAELPLGAGRAAHGAEGEP